jgi:hypothetical protein
MATLSTEHTIQEWQPSRFVYETLCHEVNPNECRADCVIGVAKKTCRLDDSNKLRKLPSKVTGFGTCERLLKSVCVANQRFSHKVNISGKRFRYFT